MCVCVGGRWGEEAGTVSLSLGFTRHTGAALAAFLFVFQAAALHLMIQAAVSTAHAVCHRGLASDGLCNNLLCPGTGLGMTQNNTGRMLAEQGHLAMQEGGPYLSMLLSPLVTTYPCVQQGTPAPLPMAVPFCLMHWPVRRPQVPQRAPSRGFP